MAIRPVSGDLFGVFQRAWCNAELRFGFHIIHAKDHRDDREKRNGQRAWYAFQTQKDGFTAL
jgi:hypothetical protein